MTIRLDPDRVVYLATAISIAAAFMAVDLHPQKAVQASARFIADCGGTVHYTISHAGPERSMHLTCEGSAR